MMRTARALTVSPVCSAPGGGAWSREGAWSWGVPGPRGGSQHALRQTPPLWTESQTPVKTLLCPNFVAGGNDLHDL